MRRTIIVIFFLSVAVALLGRSAAAQTQGQRAAIVVRFADGQNITKCVPFTEGEISGEELLKRAGFQAVIDASYGEGGAVCAINNTGCPVNDCWCECQDPTGGDCVFWSYHHWQNGSWEFSRVGAGSFVVTDGALEGWSWGEGDGQRGIPPPAFTFGQICSQATGSTPAPVSPTAPPDGSFESSALTLQAGSCAVLNWVVYGATSITLDGSPVIAQDRLEVCPQATQTYTLLATNNTGQFTRALTITVQGNAEDPASQPPVNPPTVTPVQQQQASPTVVLPALQPVTDTTLLTASAPVETPIAFLGGIAPDATPIATPTAILPRATEPPPPLALALTALPTPVSTAARDTASERLRSTPTPILLARTDIGAAPASAVTQSWPGSAEFDPALLPGYGAFLFIASLLLGGAALVWQRRRVG